jgi:asparagine synthase (glutamine-hydrolysing)
MCGLAGLYSVTPVHFDPKDAVKNMLDVARHRGPNDQGFYTTSTAAIGLNRLSIIDLTTGHQPIENENGNLVLVCNGEIYNYKPLKSQLENKGHIFRTKSDVEVILHLYEEEGVESFERLDGMFSFALLDKKNNRLFLGRDRVGIKPLYYKRTEENITYFGSEVKSLHAVLNSRNADPQVISEFMTWGYSISGRSVWKDVDILPPGHYLELSPDTFKLSSYLKEETNNSFKNPEAAIKELRKAVIQDIENQLMSDVPLGVFLSGGVDSSIIVGVVSKLLNLKVSTFSIDFESQKYSEGDKIKAVSNLYNTDHHFFLAKSNHLDILDDVIKACDEPFGDPAALPTYLLSQETVKHVTVALSGDGADEFMFGYNYHRQEKDNLSFLRQQWIHKPIGKLNWNNPLYYSILSRTAKTNGEPRNLYNIMQSHLFRFPKERQTPRFRNKSDFERQSYLPNDILYKTDRMTMYHSLEARVPFLGNNVMAVARKIPKAFQVDNTMQKLLLRKAFEDLLPPKIFNQSKHGFTTPVGDWVKEKYSEKDFKLLYARSFVPEFTNPKMVNRIIKEHFNKRFNHGRFIYRLLTVITWASIYKPTLAKTN